MGKNSPLQPAGKRLASQCPIVRGHGQKAGSDWATAGGQMSQVEQHLVPEARIQQVQHGVLRAADVEVDPTGMGSQLLLLADPPKRGSG